ncbi:hypothetical protein IKF94_01090 [Candidatus Saccharibacteria bacterium]|nr:hypothetical protein [Candidatus Saccharibacteria bacterium]
MSAEERIKGIVDAEGGKKFVPRVVHALNSLEENTEFMDIARRIAGLIKNIGTTPTPRQLKIHLDIDARKMRKVCGDLRMDPYDLLVKEARCLLLKEDGLIVGFGRMERAPEEE